MENELREIKYALESIRYLARYFYEKFVDPQNEDDKNLNTMLYGYEAFHTIVYNIVTKSEYKNFEILTSQASYENFVKIFEEYYLDELSDYFESR